MAELRAEFGGKCVACGATDGLEFAHKAKDDMSGRRGHKRRGRGGRNRYFAIRRNRGNYLLLCRSCHDLTEPGEPTAATLCGSDDARCRGRCPVGATGYCPLVDS
jgi:hypothetical protein